MGLRSRIGVFIAFLCALSLTGFVRISSASELDIKLEKIVKKLSEATPRATGIEGRPTLAVFPFQSDDKLAKKRVNVAVSEILTHQFLKTGAYRVIERSQLETVLKEQKLGLTGAVDTYTAARVGVILGAKSLVLGSISQVGKYYQIAARLVDAQTAEITASEVAEVPVKTFDEEASRYLVLVPDYQTIGFYGLLRFYGPPNVRDLPAETHFGYTITPTSPPAHMYEIGVGIRYFPFNGWMLDLAVSLKMESVSDAKPLVVEGVGSDNIYTNRWADYSGSGLDLSIGKVMKISDHFNGHVGVGYSGGELEAAGNIGSGLVTKEHPYLKYGSPFIRGGIEWKPQERVGWALFGTYYTTQERNIQKIIISNVSKDDPTVVEKTMSYYDFTFPSYSFETSLCLYF